MKPSQRYRSLAADLRRRAEQDSDLSCRAEWKTLAQLYERLAVQADQNGLTDEQYHPIPKWRDDPGSQAE